MFSVLMCALTFSVSAAAFAQHERVTLNFRQATVRQVLNEIQRQTRLSFIYNTEQTEQLGQISVEAHNESVTSLLDRILTGTGLTWKIQEDLILISQAGPETTAIPQAQEQETVLLTGTVTDIQKMPLGFQTQVSEDGGLSGGQKQRLSIARAVVKDPDIFIFDDSFSALDYKTDATLRKRLKEVTGDATVLIVAQRVGTIMDADQIIVLDQGEIVGRGTQDELMESNEIYREIANSQLDSPSLTEE